MNLLLELPAWRHQQLLAFWTNSIESEYFRGLSKLTSAHSSHETIFAQEAPLMRLLKTFFSIADGAPEDSVLGVRIIKLTC